MRRFVVLLLLIAGSSLPLFGQQSPAQPQDQQAPPSQTQQPAPSDQATPSDQAAPPQDTGSSEWYLGKPIRNIEFKGLKTVSESELRGIVDPYIGQKFTDSLFLDLQRKLYALGYFDQIVPRAIKADPQGSAVILQFEVKERPVVSDVKIEGNSRVRTSDILDVVLLKPGDMVTNAKIRLDEDAIKNLYLERGFPNATVSGSTQTDKDGKTTLVFSIDEGNQTIIKQIKFSGNTYASDSTLRGVIKSKEQSLFNSGVYQESLLEQDKQLIVKYYQDHGYVDAKVTDITKDFQTEEKDKRSLVTLTYYVDEGQQWTFGGVKFEGNSIFTTEKLSRYFKIRPGDVLNKSKIEDGYNAVANLYAENGYIFNQINLEQQRDPATRTISYTVKIVELNRAHIENIIIKGNTKTKDFVIRREIPLEPGDIFSAAKIRQGLQNLTNLQYFQSITPETPQGSVPGLMDLVLNVEEANTADVRFGVSFGGNTSFPIAGQVSWQDRNFRGLGETIGAQLSVSPAEQTVAFNYTQPWLFNKPISAGVNFSVDRATITGVPQDILYPQFPNSTDSGSVPDPFTGVYVFSKDTDFGGTIYKAGSPFPGTAAQAQPLIANGTLETDYAYAGGTTAAIPSSYLMSYINWNISLGTNLGYRIPTRVGRLGLGTGLSTSLNYVNYDDSVYRPWDETIRTSHQSWYFTNKWSFTTYLDTRDITYSPSNGYYFREDLTLAGGFLFGRSQFINTSTTLEGFLTLWDLPVTDSWSWKMVLAAHTALSVLLPQFWVPPSADANGNPYVPNAIDQLYIDGMTVGRGWPRTAGQALWDNWVELRMPLAPQVIWFDMFFEGASLWDSYRNINMGDINNFDFSFGAGFRFVIPQFPIRLYIAKRFKFVDGHFEWVQGGLFNAGSPTGGVDFVFSIGTGFY
ncbi:outer membrane protein assembly factor BamA [Salinispira pacifica]